MIRNDRIRGGMDRRGLSQAELARDVGVAQPAICSLINKAGSTQIHVVARELQTTPDYLMGETDDPESDSPDEAPLSSEARDLLQIFTGLSAVDQEALLHVARAMSGPSAGKEGRTPGPPQNTIGPKGRPFTTAAKAS